MKLGTKPLVEGDRDAVHVAIIALRAMSDIDPGQRVTLCEGGVTQSTANAVGVADPFARRVSKGELVTVCLFPDTVTGMRHHWFHPDFPESVASTVPGAPSNAESLLFIGNLASICGKTTDALLEDAHQYAVSCRNSAWPGYIYDNSERYRDVSSDAWTEFWKHFSIVTGHEPPPDTESECPYPCSC